MQNMLAACIHAKYACCMHACKTCLLHACMQMLAACMHAKPYSCRPIGKGAAGVIGYTDKTRSNWIETRLNQI